MIICYSSYWETAFGNVTTGISSATFAGGQSALTQGSYSTSRTSSLSNGAAFDTGASFSSVDSVGSTFSSSSSHSGTGHSTAAPTSNIVTVTNSGSTSATASWVTTTGTHNNTTTTNTTTRTKTVTITATTFRNYYTTATTFYTTGTFARVTTTLSSGTKTTTSGLETNTFTDTTTTSFSYKNGFGTIKMNSVFRLDAGLASFFYPATDYPIVAWFPTAASLSDLVNGRLTDRCASHTDNVTLFYSAEVLASTGTLSVASSFSTTSFSTSLASNTFSGFDVQSRATSSSAASSYHQQFIGTFNLATTEADWQVSYGAITVTLNSFSTSGSVRSLATFTTTLRRSTSTTTIRAMTTISDNDVAWDQDYPETDYVPVRARAHRTTTLAVATDTTATITSWSEGLPNTVGIASNESASFSFTNYDVTLPQITPIYSGWANEYIWPAPGAAFCPFGTAGQQSTVYQGLSAGGGLSNFFFVLPYFSSYANVAGEQAGVSIPLYLYSDTFTIGALTTAVLTNSDDTDNTFTFLGDVDFPATAQMSTVNSTDAKMSVTVGPTVGTDSTTISFDLQLVGQKNFSQMVSHQAPGTGGAWGGLYFYGGLNSVTDMPLTRRDFKFTYVPGDSTITGFCRAITTRDSSGGTSTTTTTGTTSRNSSTIPASQLVFESSYEFYSLSTGNTFLTGSLSYLTYLEAQSALITKPMFHDATSATRLPLPLPG